MKEISMVGFYKQGGVHSRTVKDYIKRGLLQLGIHYREESTLHTIKIFLTKEGCQECVRLITRRFPAKKWKYRKVLNKII